MMLREYTYLFNLAIKSLNKLFNSATCRQTYASLMERWEVLGENLYHSRISPRAFRLKFSS